MDYKIKYEKYKFKYLELENKLNATQYGGSSQKPELYLFKAEWCNYCKNFKPSWETLQKSNLKEKVNFITMDDAINKTEISQWKINGYPTLILKKGENAIEYNGERSLTKIEEFINKNVN
jgi:thiol-disulfide isomerase/thioredoxin